MNPSATPEKVIETNTLVDARGHRAPRISVVVASNRERALLDACLRSLLPQCRRLGAEILVTRPSDSGDLAIVRRGYPGVRILAAPPQSTIPQLRALGMASAQGDIVAVTEDHCVADSQWLELLAAGVDAGASVVGGGMDNAQRERAVDWAAYFSEYGFFATTRAETKGDAPLLTGANVAYTRQVIEDVIAIARDGDWENVAHDRLAASGSVMRFVATAAVYQNRNYTIRDFCGDRYRHGRDYARRRLANESRARRWMLVLGCPVLPLVLASRVARAAAAGRRKQFLRALPATLLFLSAWSAGEAAGYLAGAASDGARDVQKK